MKRKFNPVFLVLLIPLAAILFAVGSLYMKKTNVSEAAAFPYSTYIENSNALIGNAYSLKAQIDSQLAYDASVGRVICVKIESGESLAMLLPSNVASTIHPGQKYTFTVEILANGTIKILKLEKF